MSRYLRENALEDKIAKSEKDLAQVKDKWYKLNSMNPTASQKAEMDKLRKQMGDLVTQIKRDKRELKTGSAGYSKPSKDKWPESYSLEWMKNSAAKLTKNDALKNASPAEVIKSLNNFKQNQNSSITKIEIDQLIDGIKSKERWQDSDGDGKWYEPGEDVNESYLITKGGEEALRKIPLMERIRKNFIGNK